MPRTGGHLPQRYSSTLSTDEPTFQRSHRTIDVFRRRARNSVRRIMNLRIRFTPTATQLQSQRGILCTRWALPRGWCYFDLMYDYYCRRPRHTHTHRLLALATGDREGFPTDDLSTSRSHLVLQFTNSYGNTTVLPDLPDLKEDIQQVLDDYLRTQAHKKLGVWGTIPRVYVHEGNRMRTVRADGTIENTEFKEASAEFTVKRSEIPDLTPQNQLALLDRMAEQMAGKVSKNLYSSLNATLKETGQTVDSGGKPLSIELFFQTLEKMHIEFDARGEPTGLQLVVHPDMASTMQRLNEEFHSDPALQRRHKELMNKKRLEWRAREAARKLVG
jgi:hypothetical protein